MDAAYMRQAVLDYYGSGTTIWDKINLGTATSEEISFAFSQIPQRQLSIDRTASGYTLGYGYADPVYIETYKDPILESFDSNIPPGQYSSKNSLTPRINASFNYDSQTGEYTAMAGAKANGVTLSTVADRLSLGVTGVNIGCKLGKFIDETIYNSDPDFWDKHLPELNPETWTSIAGSENGKNFIRTLFNIKDNKATAYISEDVLAYTYMFLRDAGLLDETPNITPKGITTGEYTPTYIRGPADQLASTAFGLPLYPTSFSDDALLVVDWDGQTGLIVRMDGQNWDMKETVNVTEEIETGLYQTTGLTNATHMIKLYRPGGDYNPAPPGTISYEAQTNQSLTILTNGIVSSSTGRLKVISGDLTPKSVRPIPNATQYPPTNITGTTPAQVKQQLKTNYPDLFSDPITETVLQPDGSIDEITYIPIPWVVETTDPDIEIQTIPNPTTDPNTTADDQRDPQISDNTLPKILPNPVVPPPTSTTTDTGTGDTPSNPMPTGSASSLWAIYNPTQAQVDAFGAWLWTSDLVEQIKKLFVDPMQAIIGIHKVFATPQTGSSANIKCGYIESNVSAKTVTDQYVTVDCGTISLYEYFGNVFDYGPFTSVKCFLPFIGIVPLNVSNIMRAKINIKYHVDVITGACLAEIKVTRDGCKTVLYTYSGSAIVSYPISSGSYAGIISSVVQTAMGIAMGSPMTVASGILSAHADTSVNGSFNGSSGAMGCKTPYLIISRPLTRMADDINKFRGLGANYTTTIENCKGFFKVLDIHLHIEGAYQSEIDEINALLREGVLTESEYDGLYYEPQISDIEGITITENGRYVASGDIRGYSPINVNVLPVLIEKTVTSNGVYNAIDYSAVGFSVFTVNVPSSSSVMGFELYGATFGGGTQTFKGKINNNYIVCCFHDNMSSTYTLNGVSKNFTAIVNGTGSGKIYASTISVTGNVDTGLNSILLDGSQVVSHHNDSGSYMSVVGAWVGYLNGGTIYENAVSNSLTNSITMNSAHNKILIFIAGSKAGLSNVNTVSINGITYDITNMGTKYDSVYSVYAAIEIDNNTDNVITVTYPVSCHNYMSIIGFD